MPQKSRRQNATGFGNAQLSVVSCKPLLAGDTRTANDYPFEGRCSKTVGTFAEIQRLVFLWAEVLDVIEPERTQPCFELLR